jgi:hypothetical protein
MALALSCRTRSCFAAATLNQKLLKLRIQIHSYPYSPLSCHELRVLSSPLFSLDTQYPSISCSFISTFDLPLPVLCTVASPPLYLYSLLVLLLLLSTRQQTIGFPPAYLQQAGARPWTLTPYTLFLPVIWLCASQPTPTRATCQS